MDTIIINVKQINKMDISLGLYLSLYYLYCLKENPKVHAEFLKAHGPVDFGTAKSLEDLKYIKVTDGSKGEFEIPFVAIPDETSDKASFPIFQYEVTADVTDINGETRSASTIVNVGYHAIVAHLDIPNVLDSSKKG